MKIYHNPRCSKSRQSLALIQEAGIDVEVIEYLKTPPTVAELTEVISLLGVPAESIVRKKEALCQELGLSEQTLSEQQWIETCLLYTSPSPRDQRGSRMPSSA